ILSIALIAALIVGSAFAGFKKGEATISLGYDLDTTDYGFKNGTSVKYNFGFVLGEDSAAKAGEADLRAEIEASFKAEFKASDYTTEGAALADAVVSTLKITKANIIYKDITVGILSAGKSATYAADYHLDAKGNPKRNVVKSLDGVPGFTVSANGYNGGFGFNGNADAEKYAVLAHVETKSFDLAEGVTAQAAAGVKITDASKEFGVSAKGAYAKDLLSAALAVDFGYNEKAKVEVAANAAYDFVSAKVYYFTEDAFENNTLDAKVAAEKAINENITVGGSAEIIDAFVDAREIALGADATFAYAPVTLETAVSYAIFAKDFEVSADVTYAADLFTAKAGVVFGTTFGTDDSSYIYASASISSDKVIDGATLSLAYAPKTDADGNVITNYLADGTKLGAITAKCTISL
ncbi:MAG: hypothetical protein ACI4UH_03755, partial [Dorea sp.]